MCKDCDRANYGNAATTITYICQYHYDKRFPYKAPKKPEPQKGGE